MRVAEKISALAAYKRFPENRLTKDANGNILGNIIVSGNGAQHPLDHHDPSTFSNRVKDFIVGDQAFALTTEREVELGRAQTLPKLSQVLGRRGNRVIDVAGRWSKLDEGQVIDLVDWLKGIRSAAISR
jgi:hypothetical protein